MYAPTEDKDEEMRDEFYEKLENEIHKCPKHDMKIILGDFNAQVGRQDQDNSIVGNYSVHEESNKNGQRLIMMAATFNLVIGSTKFPHKRIHLATWKSPDGTTENQIDHVLIDARHKTSMMDARTYRGANMDTDHYLVTTRIRARMNSAKYTTKRTKESNFEIEKLKEENVRREYEERVEQLCKEDENNQQSEEQWARHERIIKQAAEDKIGKIKKKKRNGWFDEECEMILERKNEAYRNMIQKHNTRLAKDEYKRIRQEEKKIFKKKKKDHMEKHLQTIEETNKANESKKFYKQVNGARKGYQRGVNECRNKKGEIITSEEEVMERWKEYFEELYRAEHTILNDEDKEEEEEQETEERKAGNEEIEDRAPTNEELQKAIKKLKNNRAPGNDGINPELMKIKNEIANSRLLAIVQSTWNTERLPKEWEDSLICPIWKKGDQLKCENYRGIMLLNTAYKVFSNLLYDRLQPYAEQIIGDYQAGFRKGKSTSDQIHTLRQIMEKMTERQIDTYYIFIDFKAAYDSITRKEIYNIMKEFGIPNKLRSLVKATQNKVRCKVKTPMGTSDIFYTQRGIRQGDALSCMIFNIVLEKAIREADLKVSGTIMNKSLQMLAYADDIVLIGRTRNVVTEAFVRLETAARKYGLQINYDKTKYMELTKRPLPEKHIKIGEQIIEKVEEFKYLGAIVNTQANIKQEINNRLLMGNRCMYGLYNIISSKLIRKETKIKIYKTLIKPVVTYGSESWTITKEMEERLRIFERKVLRKIFGPVYDKEILRARYNHEIYELYKETDIVKTIKIARLRWLGHIYRMEENNYCRRITLNQPEGVRKRGRPKLRWMDNVTEDIRRLGIKKWWMKTKERDEWRQILKEAEAHPGL